MRALDRNSEYYGVSGLQLMENAGKGAADIIAKMCSNENCSILILCGLGNNGGDGFVVGRYLATAANISIGLIGSPGQIKTSISKDNFNRLPSVAKIYSEVDEILEQIEDADIIVDSMLGIGLAGPLRTPYSDIVSKINSSGKKVIALDAPTGLGTGLQVKCDSTITFHDSKIGMTPENCGRIIIQDIGIPSEALQRTGPGEFFHYPKIIKDSHKGGNGRLLIISGGPYSGAPALAGLAAYRTGVDIVTIAAPTRVTSVIASFDPAIITFDLPGDYLVPAHIDSIVQLLETHDGVLIGPGLGRNDLTYDAVRSLIKLIPETLPIIIDADAFGAITKHLELIKGRSIIATPHAREMVQLCGNEISAEFEQRKNMVIGTARDLGITILQKGAVDIISNGSQVKENHTGNSGMTVGGTGDILAGVTAGLVAKQMDLFEAAALASFIVGHSGDKVFQEHSYGLIPSDIIPELSKTLAEYIC